jgi:ribonuclease Z
MDKNILKCFGVGDGWPTNGLRHSSYMYQVGRSTLLIDCGEPISGSFRASGFNYDLIDRIFISHFHFDHVGGFFMLMQGFWLQQRQKDLVVHMPEDGIEPIRQMLNTGCIFDELMSFRTRYEPLRHATPVISDSVRLTPFLTTHLNAFKKAFSSKYPLKYEAYCFLMESDKLRIGHSADIGSPEDLDPLLTKPLDLLVCELAHVRPEILAQYLKGKKIKKILFVHLPTKLQERLEETRALLEKYLAPEQFDFAHNGDEINLTTEV